jgi:hypothetical protein
MFVLDGGIAIPAGRAFSFDALLQRIHPTTSRMQRGGGNTSNLRGGGGWTFLVESAIQYAASTLGRIRFEFFRRE